MVTLSDVLKHGHHYSCKQFIGSVQANDGLMFIRLCSAVSTFSDEDLPSLNQPIQNGMAIIDNNSRILLAA